MSYVAHAAHYVSVACAVHHMSGTCVLGPHHASVEALRGQVMQMGAVKEGTHWGLGGLVGASTHGRRWGTLVQVVYALGHIGLCWWGMLGWPEGHGCGT